MVECLPCPAGYHCPSPGKRPSPGWMLKPLGRRVKRHWGAASLASAFAPGLSSVKDYPCPPGHWCPGGQGALLCPPGTFRTEPGASSQDDCELCPPGHYCPEAEQSGHANVFATPCRAGTECPAGESAVLHPSQPLPPALHPMSSHKRPREHHTGTAWPPAGPRKPSAWSLSVHPVFGWFRAFGSPQGQGPSACFCLPQVLWPRSPAGLALTAGPRLGSPRSALGDMPAQPALQPTLAQVSCEYPNPVV